MERPLSTKPPAALAAAGRRRFETAAAPAVLAASYRYCAALTRAEARNFYYTFWFLTRERRRSIYAIYAFSRRLDDIVDASGAADVPSARERLESMRSMLEPDSSCEDPLVPALRDTVEKFRIPVEHFHELIEGMAMDIEKSRYDTFEELRLYCYRAASTVGLICIEIFGHDGNEAGAAASAVRDPAVNLGIAMQLTNILRDIPEDHARGRIYLPRDEMARFGAGEEAIARGEASESFRALMAFQVARARDHFKLAEALFPHIERGSRYCPILLKIFYSEYLDQIERAGYDVFRFRPHLSHPRKIRLAFELWLRSLAAS